MEWGIALNLREHVSEIVEKAQMANEGGIETIWITDYPATRFSPALASLIAEKVQDSRIGIGLLSPFIYSPSYILQMMTTLIETHGNRFDLLLGPGDRTKLREIGISYGDVSTLVERMTKSVNVIQEGLSDQENCRVFIGAQGPKMIEASTCSDGVLLNYSDPEMIRWAISLLHETSTGFKIGLFPPSLVGFSRPCHEHMGINTSAAVVALGLSSSIMTKFGLKEKLQPAIDRMKRESLTDDVVKMIDQNVLDRFSLCGSAKSNIARITDYNKLGIDMVIYGPPQGASLKGVERLVRAKSVYQNSKKRLISISSGVTDHSPFR